MQLAGKEHLSLVSTIQPSSAKHTDSAVEDTKVTKAISEEDEISLDYLSRQWITTN